jgi:hypothetical protein
MTSPLLRLFAVIWWLLVIGSAGPIAFFAVVLALELPDADPVVVLSWIVLLLVPYIVMTVIRWIITGRWRFGPRW